MKNILESAKELHGNFLEINSFEMVAIWDSEAKKLIEELQKSILESNENINKLSRKHNLLEKKYDELSFFQKMFSSKDEIEGVLKKISIEKNNIKEYKNCIEVLEESIEFTPDDKKEADLMLKELKLAKKELITLKKEIISRIKSNKNHSISENSNLTTQIFANSKSKPLLKMHERIKKESSDVSQEEEKAIIEKQIIVVEKMIHWIERIKI